jgi:hypothetical protein
VLWVCVCVCGCGCGWCLCGGPCNEQQQSESSLHFHDTNKTLRRGRKFLGFPSPHAALVIHVREVTHVNDDNLMLCLIYLRSHCSQTALSVCTHPSIKGTSRKTFLTTSMRSSNCIADAWCCVQNHDNRLMIIVVKHKPHNLNSAVRFRRRITLPTSPRSRLIFVIGLLCKLLLLF